MVSDSLFCRMFSSMRGRRGLFVLGSFPFFLIGKIRSAGMGTLTVRIEEGTSRELEGLEIVISVADIVMFHVETYPGQIPSLAGSSNAAAGSGPAAAAAPGAEPGEQPDIPDERVLGRSSSDPGMACGLAKCGGKNLTLVLRPTQVNMLGQVFRPIVAGRVRLLRPHLVLLNPAILKIPTAPDHRFPTPLAIPLNQIASVLPLAGDAVYPLP